MTNPNLLSAESHFAFGKNWLDYADKIDEAKIAQAISDLRRLSGRERFDGLSFLDIGCGSGLHSLAAIRLGAKCVAGVDIDRDSVAASRKTLGKYALQSDYKFDVVSVFDMSRETYGSFDIVYSWGVLHHTGDMYRALNCAAGLVKDGGTFMVALYKKTPFCGMWRGIKRSYSNASPQRQRRMMWIRTCIQRVVFMVQGKSFNDYVRDYDQFRGMNFYNDLHDWMGGYPYESISPDECHAFFEERGFKLEREFVATPSRFPRGMLGSGCDEYTFVRP